ncbi:hypothetical protein ACFZDG_35820 [Kitasatospora xanthocidica]|uniref:hypothetical protein n=1 Tax=Kitasatospora xanthocidica TaxID=83382 RepID=UPI0036E74E90
MKGTFMVMRREHDDTAAFAVLRGAGLRVLAGRDARNSVEGDINPWSRGLTNYEVASMLLFDAGEPPKGLALNWVASAIEAGDNARAAARRAWVAEELERNLYRSDQFVTPPEGE